MRLPLLVRALILIGGWLVSPTLARASHILGAELTYEYAGTNSNPLQYHVTARLYEDLSSVATQANVLLTCGKNECGMSLPGSFTSTLVRTGTQPVPASCGAVYQITVFEGTVQLAPAVWTLSINLENRSFNIVNISQSGAYSLYAKATLNNTAAANLQNSSPKFTTSRLIQLIGSQPQRYSANAFDADGDSLSYQLLQPLAAPAPTACGAPTLGTPAPHFQLNAATGELLTLPIPLQLGVYALTVQVSEFRRLNGTWQAIGSVMRDVTYTASNSANLVPAITRVATSRTPTGQLLGQVIRVNPGQLVSLQVSAADPDAGQTLTLTSDAATTVPGAAFQDQGNGQGLLTWQVPAALPPGRYAFPVSVFDSACPLRGGEARTLSFLVTRDVLAVQARHAVIVAPFPMPFRDEVRFQLTGVGHQLVTISDELGRVVARLTTTTDGRIAWRPGAELAAGLYFARTADGSQVARLAYAGR